MYDVASMTSGYEVVDTGDFEKRVMSLMAGIEAPEVESKDESPQEDDAMDTIEYIIY